MATAHDLKQRIIEVIDKLPQERLGEVPDFVDFLIACQARTDFRQATWEVPNDDPILRYIGGVEHGSLASNIDGDLCGS
jgi:hypothetical protein